MYFKTENETQLVKSFLTISKSAKGKFVVDSIAIYNYPFQLLMTSLEGFLL